MVDDVEVKRPTAPARARATACPPLDTFKETEEGTNRQIGA
jgi:hypothetical protein